MSTAGEGEACGAAHAGSTARLSRDHGHLRAALNHGVTVRRGQRSTLRGKAISTPVGP
ncbi:hypothetical protein [Streptomyces yunnanensis]|uniref:hypothetical protein n=1 Tax=Streptomyces yunnanensis TaxID=156453 RepID=UPI00142D690D|nr:hypothetical protein [Streptomyces yunnanensis]